MTVQVGQCTRCQVSVVMASMTPAGGDERLCRNCVSDLRQMEIARSSTLAHSRPSEEVND